jgi:uncharacterized protein (AIM24 family)
MPSSGNTANPTSTITVPSPGARGDANNPNDYRFVISGSGTGTISIESTAYPCAFDVFANNTAATNHGRILAYSSSSIDVVNASGLTDGAAAGANQLGAAISSGVITISAHATYPASTVVRVTRAI